MFRLRPLPDPHAPLPACSWHIQLLCHLSICGCESVRAGFGVCHTEGEQERSQNGSLWSLGAAHHWALWSRFRSLWTTVICNQINQLLLCHLWTNRSVVSTEAFIFAHLLENIVSETATDWSGWVVEQTWFWRESGPCGTLLAASAWRFCPCNAWTCYRASGDKMLLCVFRFWMLRSHVSAKWLGLSRNLHIGGKWIPDCWSCTLNSLMRCLPVCWHAFLCTGSVHNMMGLTQ